MAAAIPSGSSKLGSHSPPPPTPAFHSEDHTRAYTHTHAPRCQALHSWSAWPLSRDPQHCLLYTRADSHAGSALMIACPGSKQRRFALSVPGQGCG